jgi:hypothetical protein
MGDVSNTVINIDKIYPQAGLITLEIRNHTDFFKVAKFLEPVFVFNPGGILFVAAEDEISVASRSSIFIVLDAAPMTMAHWEDGNPISGIYVPMNVVLFSEESARKYVHHRTKQIVDAIEFVSVRMSNVGHTLTISRWDDSYDVERNWPIGGPKVGIDMEAIKSKAIEDLAKPGLKEEVDNYKWAMKQPISGRVFLQIGQRKE